MDLPKPPCTAYLAERPACPRPSPWSAILKIMFELIDDEPPDGGDLEVMMATNSYYVTYPFAECADTGRMTSLECYLTPKNGVICEGMMALDFYEFGFYFSVAHNWGSGPIVDVMDRDSAQEFLPPGCQDFVMRTVALGCQCLLTCAKPAHLYRVASVPHLPEKALRKHDMVTAAAQAAGYRLEYEGTDEWGRRFWFMMPPPLALTARGPT